MAKQQKRNAVATTADTRPVPKFLNEAGELVLTKLKGKDFPKTKDGRVAYCRYQSARWEAKAIREAAKGDPTQKKLLKIDKLQKMLALLQGEVAADKETK